MGCCYCDAAGSRSRAALRQFEGCSGAELNHRHSDFQSAQTLYISISYAGMCPWCAMQRRRRMCGGLTRFCILWEFVGDSVNRWKQLRDRIFSDKEFKTPRHFSMRPTGAHHHREQRKISASFLKPKTSCNHISSVKHTIISGLSLTKERHLSPNSWNSLIEIPID